MDTPVVIFATIILIIALLLIITCGINKCIKICGKGYKSRYNINIQEQRERDRIILELFPDVTNNNANNSPNNSTNGEIEYLYDIDDNNK